MPRTGPQSWGSPRRLWQYTWKDPGYRPANPKVRAGLSGPSRGDSEFTGLLTGVEARRQGSYSPLAVVRLDGRQWAPLVHGQKDRLLRKASVLLVEACRPYQAGHGSACMARFVDDLGTIVGWSVAGGTNPEQYQYQITGP